MGKVKSRSSSCADKGSGVQEEVEVGTSNDDDGLMGVGIISPPPPRFTAAAAAAVENSLPAMAITILPREPTAVVKSRRGGEGAVLAALGEGRVDWRRRRVEIFIRKKKREVGK